MLVSCGALENANKKVELQPCSADAKVHPTDHMTVLGKEGAMIGRVCAGSRGLSLVLYYGTRRMLLCLKSIRTAKAASRT